MNCRKFEEVYGKMILCVCLVYFVYILDVVQFELNCIQVNIIRSVTFKYYNFYVSYTKRIVFVGLPIVNNISKSKTVYIEMENLN